MVYLTRKAEFAASHYYHNPELSPQENRRIFGKCNNPNGHGHNYLLEVTVSGALDPATGMSVDIGVVDRAVKAAVLDRVDHYDLSATVPALAGVITTGENLARTFWEWLEGALPPGSLRRVTLVETANNVFEYRGESTPAR